MIRDSNKLIYSTADLKMGHFYKDMANDLFIWVKVRGLFYAIGAEGMSWADDVIMFPCTEIFSIFQDGEED